MAEVYSKGTFSGSQNALKLGIYNGLQYWLNMSRYVSEYTPTHPWSQNQMVISAATSLHAAITVDINGSNIPLRNQVTKLRDSIIEETEKDLRFVDKNENFEGANRSYRYQGLRARVAFVGDYNRASTSIPTSTILLRQGSCPISLG